MPDNQQVRTGLLKPIRAHSLSVSAIALMAILTASSAEAGPPIRISEKNKVPACVTPQRLMAFLGDRNPSLDPQYGEIARWYQHYGLAWRVRWDYAFFQMIVETNALSFRRGNGRRGDVHENQFNFAGIGATGGGVAGNRFRDIATGVHAQIQHLVAYSGERLAQPIAQRTRDNQDDIIEISLRLRRPVTFNDLAKRWAVDRKYGKTIDYVADQFTARYCTPGSESAEQEALVTIPPVPKPAKRPWHFPPPSGLGGPNPQKLAGPVGNNGAEEELPWLAKPEKPHATIPRTPGKPKATAQSSEAPRTKSRKPVEQPPSVRTIWTRGDNNRPFNPGAAPAPVVGSHEIEQAPGFGDAPDGTSLSFEEPVLGTDLNANEPAQQPTQDIARGPADAQAMPQAAPTEDAAPSLPHFRIAPLAGDPPSKLGGPMPEPDAIAPQLEQEPQPPAASAAPPAQTAYVPPIVPGLPGMPQEAPTAPATQNDAASEPHCRVISASYGGTKTLLLRSEAGSETRFTALTVYDGFEKSMFETFARVKAPGATIIGEYPSSDAALADAKVNCPDG